MAGIAQIEGTAQTFIYNGLICFGTAVSDYSTATADTIMTTMVGVGSIPDGTTEWTGEDTETENWEDEAGNVLDAVVTYGSNGFSFELASLSEAQVAKWLSAAQITRSDSTLSENLSSSAKVYGSAEFTIQELPGLIINQTKDLGFLFPKMRVVGGLAYSDKKFTISVAATALTVNTTNLKTFMPIYGGIVME